MILLVFFLSVIAFSESSTQKSDSSHMEYAQVISRKAFWFQKLTDAFIRSIRNLDLISIVTVANELCTFWLTKD